MKTVFAFAVTAGTVAFPSCCKRCPDPTPCPPAATAAACCDNAPNTPGLTGLNGDNTSPTTGPNVADLMVDATLTNVDDLADRSMRHLHAEVLNKVAGGNCAVGPRAIITLPPESRVDHVTAVRGDGAPLTWTQCGATIEVQLDSMCPGYKANRVDVFVKVPIFPAAKCMSDFGVIVFSRSGDPDPSDNYWWWARHCGPESTDIMALPADVGPRH